MFLQHFNTNNLIAHEKIEDKKHKTACKKSNIIFAFPVEFIIDFEIIIE